MLIDQTDLKVLPSGKCRGFNFDHAKNHCSLDYEMQSSAKQPIQEILVPRNGTDYYEKICLSCKIN